MLYFEEMGQPKLAFECVLVREGKGYSALCLDLDVASQGSVPARAKRALREAVELYLDSALESSRPYLRPVPKADDPRTRTPGQVVESFRLGVDLSVRVRV